MKVKAHEKLIIKMWPEKLKGYVVKASELAKEAGQFHVFRTS